MNMKTRKYMTPLLSAIAASMLCANLAAVVSAHGVYQKFDTEGWSQPIISVLIQGLSQSGPVWEPADRNTKDSSPSLLASSQSSTGEIPDVLAGQPETAVSVGLSGNGQADPDAGNPDHNANNQLNPNANSPHSGSCNTQNPGSAAADAPQLPDAAAQSAPKQYSFTEVTQDYFDDALFIGDSRVTGVALYSGWDNLTYYAEGGMTVYNMLQSKTAQVDGQTLSIEEALQKRSFGKIYLEIGINEMGTGTADSFMEAYEAAVARLQELQPDAILYVCGIMYVKQSKSESDPIFNNPAIQERNDRIARLADGENIFYLDINEVVTDETGHLNPDYTWDEVHLLGKYDVLWLEYFSSHAIVKEDL